MEWIKLAQGRTLRWAHAYIIMDPWVPLDARNLLSIACNRRKHLPSLLAIRQSISLLTKVCRFGTVNTVPKSSLKFTIPRSIKKNACVYQNIKHNTSNRQTENCRTS